MNRSVAVVGWGVLYLATLARDDKRYATPLPAASSVEARGSQGGVPFSLSGTASAQRCN